MTSFRFASVARATMIATGLLASAAPAQPLQPAGGWTVDYGETQCIALRKYGAGVDSMTLALRPSFNRESFEILLSREGSGPSSIEQEQGEVDLGAGPIKSRVLKYKTPGSRISVQRYRLPAEEVRRTTDAREMAFGNGKKKVSVSRAGLGAVIRALDTCLADLRKHWNSDAAAGTVATSARGDIRGLFTPDDYPAIALTEQLEGQATFTLLVDEKGKVAGCDLVSPSGVPVLDVMGCEVFRKRAQFNPARNTAGQPVRGTVVTPPVRWRVE